MPPWFALPDSPALNEQSTVAIVGAGLAGCWLAHELGRLDVKVCLLDRGPGPASAASGNAVGVVKPFVTRDRGRSEDFHVRAHTHLLDRLDIDGLAEAAGFHTAGVVQLLKSAWTERDDLEVLDREGVLRTCAIQHDQLDAEATGVHFPSGGWLDPRALCHALVARSNAETHFGAPAVITPTARPESPWRVSSATISRDVAHVVLANGPAIASMAQTAHLPVTPARGQIDQFAIDHEPRRAADAELSPVQKVVTGKHWCVPADGTRYVGSTYQREELDTDVRSVDTDSNRAGLEALLGDTPGRHISARAGVRATTPDRMPFVGPVCDVKVARHAWREMNKGKPDHHYARPDYYNGLHVLGGFGSRGIVTAAYSAALLARWLCQQDTDQSGHDLQSWFAELSPHRFIVRDARKGRLAHLRGPFAQR